LTLQGWKKEHDTEVQVRFENQTEQKKRTTRSILADQ